MPKGPRKQERFVTKDFSGGLVTQLPPHLLAPSQCPVFQNCDPSSHAGIALKRKGRTRFSASLATPSGDGSISGLFVLNLDGSVAGTTTYYIATEGTKVWRFTGAAWTDITAAGATSKPILNVDCWMATLLNKLVITMGWNSSGTNVRIPQTWDGVAATTSDIGVAPLGAGIPDPTATKYCASHNRSMFYANNNANTSGLWKSAVGTVDTWNTANDSFFQPVNAGDGDVIRAITELGDVLLIAKQNSIHFMYGTNFDEYRIVKHRLANRGVISDRGWTVYGGLFCYAGADGIYAVGPNSFSELSIPFKDKYLAITDKTTIAAGTYRDQVWFCFKDTASATNNSAFVVDLRRGTWAYYTNIVARVFWRDVDGSLYAGLSTTGTTSKVMLHDQGTQDEGVNITQKLTTMAYDFKHFIADKLCDTMYLWYQPLTGGTLTADLLVDGVSLGVVDPSSGWPINFKMDVPALTSGGIPGAIDGFIMTKTSNVARGKLFQVALTNSDSAQTQFFGVGMDADVFEPVQSDQ